MNIVFQLIKIRKRDKQRLFQLTKYWMQMMLFKQIFLVYFLKIILIFNLMKYLISLIYFRIINKYCLFRQNFYLI